MKKTIPSRVSEAPVSSRHPMCWPVRATPKGRARTRLSAVIDWTTTSEARSSAMAWTTQPVDLEDGAGQPDRPAQDLEQEPGVVSCGGQGALLLEDGAESEEHGREDGQRRAHGEKVTGLPGVSVGAAYEATTGIRAAHS